MSRQEFLKSLILEDSERMRLLRLVQSLQLPDCWIGAGFVRSAVWDHLHNRPRTLKDDVDVVWFDNQNATETIDRDLEVRLKHAESSIPWSVKNQARMHIRNGDAPYVSTSGAISRWPETATAVAVRLTDKGLEIIAPHGLEDVFAMIVRPTPAFVDTKWPIFQARFREKRWLERWPHLRVQERA